MSEPQVDLIPHSRPLMPEGEEWAEVTRRIVPGWAADGPVTAEFEAAASGWLGCSDGVAVNSGSSALQLALTAIGVAGREVLVPAYCCAALLNAVAGAGGTPVLVDSEPGGFNMCPEDAARRRSHRAAATVYAHMFGTAGDIEPFRTIGLPIVEDCAQSLGAWYSGRQCGGGGDWAVGSFFATKVLSTGHGGLVAASDPGRLASVRDLILYDNREDWSPRFNYRFTELQAALGLWGLERLPGALARRRQIAAFYDGLFRPREIEPASPSASEDGPIWFRYLLRVPDAESVHAALCRVGVDAKRPVYAPLNRYLGGVFPNAERAHRETASLPIHPSLTDAQIEAVARALLNLPKALTVASR